MVSLVEKNTFLEVEGLEEENEFGARPRRSVASEPAGARRISSTSSAPGGESPVFRHVSIMEPIMSTGFSDISGACSLPQSERSMRPVYLPRELHGAKVLMNVEGDRWQVTNEFLQSQQADGIHYRNSKNKDDLSTDSNCVPWETVLEDGFDEDDGWVSFEVALKPEFSPLEALRSDYEQQQKLKTMKSTEDSDSDSGSVQDSCGPTAEPAAEDTVPSDQRTSLMVRGLDPGLSQTGFVQHFLDRDYAGLFDFAYMPMNFRNSGNSFGYAFINFTSHAVAEGVITLFESAECPSELQGWSATWSSCQGSDGNIERYRNSPLMHPLVPAECKPVLFDPNGDQVPFPAPTKKIPKPRVQKPATTGSMTLSDTQHQEQHDGQTSAGYGMASAPSAGMESGDAALIEQEPRHRPGRCKRRQPRKKVTPQGSTGTD